MRCGFYSAGLQKVSGDLLKNGKFPQIASERPIPGAGTNPEKGLTRSKDPELITRLPVSPHSSACRQTHP
jgi:hypothetical protein